MSVTDPARGGVSARVGGWSFHRLALAFKKRLGFCRLTRALADAADGEIDLDGDTTIT